MCYVTKLMFKDKIILISIIISVFAILASIFLLLFSYLGLWCKPVSFFVKTDKNATTTQKFIYFNQLDGQGVKTEEEQAPDVVGIMIDNSVDGKLQSGISQAKIVYEAPAEGNITRLMALYDSKQKIDLVGPVRSARPYFIDWMKEYGSTMYMHSGGSPSALKKLKIPKGSLRDTTELFDADEFSYQNYYWRDYSQSAPHNLFTNSDKWQKLFSAYNNQTKDKWSGWKFGQVQISTSSEMIKNIILPYSNSFEVSWKYNKDDKKYERYINGYKDIDKQGQSIKVDNILVQYVYTQVLDEEGRLEIGVIGSGDARILRAGEMIRGSWKKTDMNSRTRFFDSDSEEVVLVVGKTWVMVVPNGMVVRVGS